MRGNPVQGYLAHGKTPPPKDHYPSSGHGVKFRPPVEFPEKLNGSSVLVAPGNLHEGTGEGGRFQTHFRSRRSPIMPSNGAAARADSGSGRWGAAEEGIGRSSAAAPQKGWARWIDERGPASGGSVEDGEVSAALGTGLL